MVISFIKKVIIVICLVVLNSSNVFAGSMDELLIKSVSSNNVNMVRTALANGADINYNMVNYGTPLSIAIEKRNADLVYYFLKNGADVNLNVSRSGIKTPPLVLAAQFGDLRISQYLVAAGANVNSYDDNGDTALIFAISNFPNAKLIQYLISQNADVNQQSNRGLTPLMAAARGSSSINEQQTRLWAAKLLLNKGADPAAMNNNMKTALQFAIDTNYTEMINLLLPISPK